MSRTFFLKRANMFHKLSHTFFDGTKQFFTIWKYFFKVYTHFKEIAYIYFLNMWIFLRSRTAIHSRPPMTLVGTTATGQRPKPVDRKGRWKIEPTDSLAWPWTTSRRDWTHALFLGCVVVITARSNAARTRSCLLMGRSQIVGVPMPSSHRSRRWR